MLFKETQTVQDWNNASHGNRSQGPRYRGGKKLQSWGRPLLIEAHLATYRRSGLATEALHKLGVVVQACDLSTWKAGELRTQELARRQAPEDQLWPPL